MKQSSKSLGQIGGFMHDEELMKELQPPVSHQTKNGGGSYGVEGFC